MSLVKEVLQDMLQALEFVMSMFVKVSRSTTQRLEHLMSRFTAVLQSMPSPLEIGACIAVVDIIEGNNYCQLALAVTSLFLKVCDWHIPTTRHPRAMIPYSTAGATEHAVNQAW